jgi:hypothetical protein
MDESIFDCIKTDSEYAEWKVLARRGKKFDCIKALRTLHRLDLKAAKDVVERYVSEVEADDSKIVVQLDGCTQLVAIRRADGLYDITQRQIKNVAQYVARHDLHQYIADLAVTYGATQAGPTA